MKDSVYKVAFAASFFFCSFAIAVAYGRWRTLTDHQAQRRSLESLRQGVVRPPVGLLEVESPPRPSSPVAEAVAALAAKAPKGPGAVPLISGEDLFARAPTLKAAFLGARKAAIELEFGPFLRTLGLSVDEIDKFYAIYNVREETWAKLRVDISEGRITSKEFKDLDESSVKLREASLADILGAEKYNELKKFRDTEALRHSMISLDTLKQVSLSTGNPVSEDQIRRLLAAAERSNITKMWTSASSISNESFVEMSRAAATILNAGQLEAFDLLLDHWQVAVARTMIREQRGR